MAYKSTSKAPFRGPLFYIWNLIYTERIIQLMVGLGVWVHMILLDVARIIQKSGERLTATFALCTSKKLVVVVIHISE